MRLEDIRLNWPVVLFSLAFIAATWLIFALAPAASSRADLRGLLDRGRLGSPSVAVRQGLMVVQVALAGVLAIGAGLLTKSFLRLSQVDPGFDPAGVVMATLQLPESRYPMPKAWPVLEWPQAAGFQQQLLDDLKALPGVRHAALAYYSAFDSGWTTRVTVEGRPAPPPGEQPEAHFRPISEDYFEVLRIPLRRGRRFLPLDDAYHPKVAIIDEAFARVHFPGEDPVGRRISVYGVPREIVGVAAGVRFRALSTEAQPTMYLPSGQNPLSQYTILLRTTTDPLSMAGVMRQRVRVIDKDLALYDLASLEEVLSGSLAGRRFTMSLLSGFAFAALLLAAIGIYGVVSYLAGRRTHEIGLRQALGAGSGAILGLIVGGGLRLAAAGAVLALLGGFVFSRWIGALLFDTASTDPSTFALTAVLLLAIAAAASLIPAWRAVRVAPSLALRQD